MLSLRSTPRCYDMRASARARAVHAARSALMLNRLRRRRALFASAARTKEKKIQSHPSSGARYSTRDACPDTAFDSTVRWRAAASALRLFTRAASATRRLLSVVHKPTSTPDE